MIGLPGVERAGRLEDGSIALGGLDLLGDRRDDSIHDGIEDAERSFAVGNELVRPDDPRVGRLRELDDHGDAITLAAYAPARHVLDVEDASGLLRVDPAVAQGVHGATRDDEQGPELREPRDDVVRQAVGEMASRHGLRSRLDERHDGDGRATPRARRGLRRRLAHVEGRRRRRGLDPRRMPPRAQRRPIEALVLEGEDRSRHVLLGVSKALRSEERREHHLVRAAFERREL